MRTSGDVKKSMYDVRSQSRRLRYDICGKHTASTWDMCLRSSNVLVESASTVPDTRDTLTAWAIPNAYAPHGAVGDDTPWPPIRPIVVNTAKGYIKELQR